MFNKLVASFGGKITYLRELGKDIEMPAQSFDWLLQNIKELKKLAEMVKPSIERPLKSLLKEDPTYVRERVWSLKKLLLLAGYIPMYLQIIRSASWVKRVAYIDAFSGCGLSFVGGSLDDVVVGSPLIAFCWPKIMSNRINRFRMVRPFDVLIFIDNDRKKCEILRKVLNELDDGTSKYYVIYGDVNQKINEVIDKAELESSGAHYLLFIDPFADLDLQLYWDNLNKLLNYGGDVIVNLHSPTLARGIESAKQEKVRQFLGDDGYNFFMQAREGGTPIEEATRLSYKEAFHKAGRNKVLEFPVETMQGKVLYYLLFATRQTASNSRWLDNYINWARNKIGRYSARDLKIIWGIVKGEQKTILGKREMQRKINEFTK